MTFSQSAAANFVPILARIVLCLVFVPAGWSKLMKNDVFTGDEAKRLRELEVVSADDLAPAPLVALSASGVRTASFVQTPPREPPSQPPSQPAEDDEQAAETPAKPKPPSDAPKVAPPSKPFEPKMQPPAEGISPDAVAPVEARMLHHVTLLVDRKLGWSYPVALAWLATGTELVGGVLVLVGLFTRVWGLGLAITMGVAFYTTSFETFLKTWGFSMAPLESATFASQIALFALAFGLLVTGSGALALDRAIFRSREPKIIEE